jgi:hypothetical protein
MGEEKGENTTDKRSFAWVCSGKGGKGREGASSTRRKGDG